MIRSRKYVDFSSVLFILCLGFLLPVEARPQEKLFFGHDEFPREVYVSRRAAFMEQMDGGIAIIPGKIRNSYGQVDERQAHYFYYLTGIEESGVWCVLDPESPEPYRLFVRPYSLRNLIWSGKETGIEVAEQFYGADQAYEVNGLDRQIRRLIQGKKKLYINMNDRWLMERIISWTSRSSELVLVNARPILDEMRVIKDAYEQDRLRTAASITADAVIEAMKFVTPGVWEYEIEAVIEYMFRSKGAFGPGFSSIVGSGSMSTVLHYDTNQRCTSDGDMIVMDVGAQVDYYTADVTRTIPVNGRFNEAQKAIYNLVLGAQEQAIEQMMPGRGLEEAHLKASEVIVEGLYRLGLITDAGKQWQRELFVLYENSHYIGLYVHDVGDYGREVREGRALLPGMVLTIEPGIYIHPLLLKTLHERLAESVDPVEIDAYIAAVQPIFEQYRGIGVRIEDDILITETGQENLSEKVPRKVGDIESLMRKRSLFNRI